MPFFVANNGPHAGQRYDLKPGRMVIGRQPGCDIIVDVGAVSRQHAAVHCEGEACFIEDLNSRNGTFLNEERVVGRRPLRLGDKVRVCEVDFTYQDQSAPQPTAKQTATLAGGGHAMMVDDETSGIGSTIMSKLDVSTGMAGVRLSASPEAKLNALIEITTNMGKALSLDEVLPKVLGSLFKIFMQADRGFIVTRGEKGELIPRWAKTRRDNEDTIRISKTIINSVIDSKEAILSADAATDSRFEMSQSIADFRIRSMMCAPLIDSEGKAFGALQIDTLDQRSRFQRDDLEVLASVAAQASIAIENARLHERALHQREIERDLQIANQVQKGFLPRSVPKIEGYHFYNYYHPQNLVGGDYFDYLQLPDGRIAVIVADVVGHGIAAALLMAKLSAEIRYCLASESNPAAALTRLNNTFTNLEFDERFVTLVMTVLNPAAHEVSMVSAGHMAPFLRKPNGTVEEPGEQVISLPLGVMDGIDYEQYTFPLEPGEVLTMYTDGINEAMNEADAQYGIERLRTRVAGPCGSLDDYGKAIIDDVRQFIGRRPQYDDMCLVCFGRKPVK